MAVCTSCNIDNRDIALYCKQCGTKIQQQLSTPSTPTPLLSQLEGLEEVKAGLSKPIVLIKGMMKVGNPNRENLNTVLVGNSGTAKSLIGKLIFDTLKSCNYLKANKPVYMTSGEFILLDIDKVNNLYNGARGGMIIIDNAQDLIIDGEAAAPLKQLLVCIDQYGCDPIIILSGLPVGLKDFLIKDENSNFNGRFGFPFFIDNYPPETMFSIIKKDLEKKYALILAPGTVNKLHKRCDYLCREMNKAQSLLDGKNGYLALKESQNIAGEYFRRQGTDYTVSPDDITGPIFERKTTDQILAELDNFVGMQEIKNEIKKICKTAKTNNGKVDNLHFAITGNPGTGKTTVARTLGEIFASIGALPIGHVIEAGKDDLVAGYVGQTGKTTAKVIDSAMGGVLFIDEAYDLATKSSNGFEGDAINTLLRRVENFRDRFSCVIAGYKNKMDDLYASNAGVESRFPRRLHIEDYTADELLEIYKRMVTKGGFTMTNDAKDKAASYFKEHVLRKTDNFANGRDARTLYEKTKENLNSRICDQALSDTTDRKLIIADDIPSLRQGAEKISLADVEKKLNDLIGLQAVKDKIEILKQKVDTNKLADTVELIEEHFLFQGNPGTGKTTVAQLFADLLFALEVLPTNNLTVAMKSDFTGGQSKTIAENTEYIITKAMGGVLFLDEAYDLVSGGGGSDIITVLLNRMEQDRGKFIVIAAGYQKEMKDFKDSNPGLEKRFTTTIDFEDYSADELGRIFHFMAEKKGYSFSNEADKKLTQIFERMVAMKTKNFANAREARNMLALTQENIAVRIAGERRKGKTDDELKIRAKHIEAEDLNIGESPTEDFKTKAMEALNQQIGLQSVKDTVARLLATIEIQKERGNTTPLAKHFIFKGNPGTGKTTIARILADVFYAIGLLPTRNLIEVKSRNLIAQYVGQSAHHTEKAIDSAMGGLLFIDEAYDLSGSDFGTKAVNTLLDRMESDRGKFIVIAAGYPKKMDTFLDMNQGLKDRFTDTLLFEDYTPDELSRIYKLFADKEGYDLGTGVIEQVAAIFTPLCKAKQDSFGNGRLARKLFDKSKETQSLRLHTEKKNGIDPDQYKQIANIITIEDLNKAAETI